MFLVLNRVIIMTGIKELTKHSCAQHNDITYEQPLNFKKINIPISGFSMTIYNYFNYKN